MRIVIDTNIWVSGLLWQGLPWELLRLAEAGRIELCVSPSILTELTRVLGYKRLQPRLERLGLTVHDLIAYVLNLSSVFEVPQGDPIVIADPDDDVFLRCAVVAKAVCVVSGDHHLLDLGSYVGIPIVSVHDFFNEFLALD